MASDPSTRDDLRVRQYPEMALSNISNPLSKPILIDPSLSPAARAAKRFQVEGNAVSEYDEHHVMVRC